MNLISTSSFFILAATMAIVAAGPGPEHGHHGHDHGHDRGHVHGPGHDHGTGGDHGTGNDHGAGGGSNERHRLETTQETPITTLEPGRCHKVVSAVITVTESYQQSRRVETRTRCGWLHLAHCKKYRLAYQIAYRQVTRLVYAKVPKCCPDFMEVNGVCEPKRGRTLPPTTAATAMPGPNATTSEPVPTDDMMMMDNRVQKIVAFVIILVSVLIFGFVIGAVVVHCCGGRKQVMKRIATSRFTRSFTRTFTRRSRHHETTVTTGNNNGNKTFAPADEPPRYDETPRYNNTPFYDETPRYTGTPLYDETPPCKVSPFYDETPRSDGACLPVYGNTGDDATSACSKPVASPRTNPTAPPCDGPYENLDGEDMAEPSTKPDQAAEKPVYMECHGDQGGENMEQKKGCHYLELDFEENLPAKPGHY